MRDDRTPDLETKLTLYLVNRWANHPTWNAFWMVVSQWTPVVMVLLIALATFGYDLTVASYPSATLSGLAAVTAAIGARLVNEPLGKLFHRSRPFEDLGFTPLVSHDSGASFPSNHATGAFALAVSMLGVPGYGIILMVLATGLLIARVYVGLHYLTDVLAGALSGSAAACCVLFAFHWLHISSVISTW